MFRRVFLSVGLLSLATAFASTDGPCCVTCADPSTAKYYSIDHAHGFCGECCMEPKHYGVYKLFEPGLLKAETDSPCADAHYHNYSSTVTHGVWPILMTLDLYGPDKPAPTGDITIASFDGAQGTTFSWAAVNDPVMGGQSNSSVTVEKGFADWQGEVKTVPFLHAPGFCTAHTTDNDGFPDVSGTDSLRLTLRNLQSELTSFQVQIGTRGGKVGFKTGVYVASFNVTEGEQHIQVPWSDFRLTWRGEDLPSGPALSTQLDQLDQVGLSTSFPGVDGTFHVQLLSVAAVHSAVRSDNVDARLKAAALLSGSAPTPPRALRGDTAGYSDGAVVLKALPEKYVDLNTFDGAKGTTYEWRDMNDPVMGGQSVATWSVDAAKNLGVFNGTCAIVPSLKAPGFCNAETTGGYFTRMADASPHSHLILVVRTTTPAYGGFKVSFAADVLIRQFFSYKANFPALAATSDWQVVAIPFSGFSNDWSSYTGDCDTVDPTKKQHHCCTAEHPEVCPTAKNLRDISQLGLWAEGAEGDFHLEIQRIGAGSP